MRNVEEERWFSSTAVTSPTHAHQNITGTGILQVLEYYRYWNITGTGILHVLK